MSALPELNTVEIARLPPHHGARIYRDLVLAAILTLRSFGERWRVMSFTPTLVDGEQ